MGLQRMHEYIEREAAVKVAEKYGLVNGSALGRHTGLADCIASEIADINCGAKMEMEEEK